MSWRRRDDLAPSDAGFEAEGGTLEQLLDSAVDATLAAMVEDPTGLAPRVRRPVVLEAPDEEALLFDLLQEVIYRKDAERLLLRLEHARVSQSPAGLLLEGSLAGEAIDAERQELITDVKAVTLHRFRLERLATGWRAVVVLDV